MTRFVRLTIILLSISAAGAAFAADDSKKDDSKKDDSSSSKKDDTPKIAGQYTLQQTSVPCDKSQEIDGVKYDCSETEGHVNQAALANTMGNLVGQTVVGANATIQSSNAAQAGTMSANVKAASITTDLAGKLKTAQGLIDVYYGSRQIQDMNRHSDNEQELKTFTRDASNPYNNQVDAKGETSANGVYAKTYQDLSSKGLTANNIPTSAPALSGDEARLRGEMGDDSAALLAQRQAELSDKRSLAKDAATEQATASHKAKIGATNSMFMGTIEAIQGLMMSKAARDQRAAADAMAHAESGNGAGASFTGGGFGGADTLAPGGNNGLTGNGFSSQGAAATDQAAPAPGGGGLGDGFNTDKPQAEPSGSPGANTFAAGAPPAGGGGGGGGGLGGGSGLSPATPDNADTTPKLAEGKSNSGYEGGSGMSMGGNRGGSNVGPDLSGLLSQLMGKGEDPSAKGGIMDYRKGRSPANENFGLLDRNVNIFERVHDAYQMKQKLHYVGI